MKRKKMKSVRVFAMGSVFFFCSGFLGMCEKQSDTPSTSSNTTQNEVTYKYYVFVTNSTDGTVSTFLEDPTTGALTSVSVATAGTTPGPIVVHPSGKYLYVINQGDGKIQTFYIDKTTGALTTIGVPLTSGTRSVTVDPSGKFAYTVQYGTSPVPAVYMYTIDGTTGILIPTTPTSVSISATGNFGPINIAVNPTSTYAYVSNNHDNVIDVFSINSTTGVLSSSSSLNPASNNNLGPKNVTGLTMDPSGKFVYGANNQTPAGMDTYSVNQSTGALSRSSFVGDSGTSGLGGVGPSAGVLDSTGTCLYVAGGNVSSVYAFSVNTNTGVLTHLSSSPYSGPSKLPVVDPQDKFVYVIGPNNAISMYSKDSTCALTALNSATVSTGAAPFGIAAVKIQQ
jgi:6-phosphogluconolactonase (cycloisomerase 2 family)